ncbi:uncharacterized protein PHA67_021891 [Liasis olivaceus]
MRQAWRGGPRAPAWAAAEGGVETRLAEVNRLHLEIQGKAPSRDDPEALVKWSWLAETAGDPGDRGKQETRAPIPATVDRYEAAPEARCKNQRWRIEVGDARQTAGTCYRCGGKGHRMVQCPSRQGVLASCTEDGGRRFPATRNPDQSWEEAAAHGAACSGAGWLTRKPGSTRRGEQASRRQQPATLRRTPEQPTEWQHEEERDSRNCSPMKIRVHLKGVRSEAEAKVDALLDSGCTHCLIHPVLASALGLRVRRLREPLTLSQLDGSTAGGGPAQYHTEPVVLTVGTSWEELGLVVDPVADHALVLGLAWLTRQNPHIDWAAKTVRFGSTTGSSHGGGTRAEDPTELCEVTAARRRAEGQQAAAATAVGPRQPTTCEARMAPRETGRGAGAASARDGAAAETVRFNSATGQTGSSRGEGAGAENPMKLEEVAAAGRGAKGWEAAAAMAVGPRRPTAYEANMRTAPRVTDKREGLTAEAMVASTAKGPTATQRVAAAETAAAGPEGSAAKQTATTLAPRAGAVVVTGAEKSTPSASGEIGGRPGPCHAQGNLEGCRTLRKLPLESMDPTMTQLEAKGRAQPPTEKQGKGAKPELRQRCVEASEGDPWLANNKDSLKKQGTC